MHACTQPRIAARLLDPAQVLPLENADDQACFYSLHHIIRKDSAKDEDMLGDAAFPEFHRLLDPGDGKHGAPFPGKPFSHRYRAMSVSVRLDYWNQSGWRNLFANASDIMGKVIEVYFRIRLEAHEIPAVKSDSPQRRSIIPKTRWPDSRGQDRSIRECRENQQLIHKSP